MNAFNKTIDHIGAFLRLRKQFHNPYVITLMRLGVIKTPYFPYRFTNGTHSFTMLGRPAQASNTDLFILREIFIRQAYKRILPLLPKGPLRIVDVGANIGSFTVWMHATVGVSEAFCFEPVPDTRRLLAYNLSVNKCEGAKVMAAAMGGSARTISIALNEENPGASSIYDVPPPGKATEVPVLAFEDWAKSIPGNFDVLKLDCEGAEWEIARHSSAEQLRRFPIIVGEVHDDPEQNQPPGEFIKLMESKGYETIFWDGHSAGVYVGRQRR